ncbi:nucleotide sugar dehydrogenase [Paenibacillus kobensis]|uniref:nucleotide sugar dehydrogenase n=1 Tax=Paenibacillus kobensis TaxID=59841 RepID=UPI000FD7ABF7|nr:nucleotide sugar dehydrogenase [Paenibacillus kobensis]
MSKICTIGLGYIGLPTSAIFAQYGSEVVGVDISRDIVEQINAGKLHIKEPGLDEIVREVVASGMFRASLVPESADAFIIAVPTPNLNDDNNSCDLSHVLKATAQVIPHLQKGNVLIIESTIAPRTMDDYIRPMVEKAGFLVGKDIYLVHCPERVLPGKILHELVYNNRIVGGITPACAEAGERLYSLFVQGEIIRTDAKTAEMSKLMENTYRDVNIALSNELVQICHSLSIDALDVIKLANNHPRVNLHQPGPGVGGHCLAVDPYFIVSKAPELSRMIRLARKTNESMPEFVADRVAELLTGVEKPVVAVLGITYKADVDDIRESPALDVVTLLVKAGYEVRIHDSNVKTPIYRMMSIEEAARGAHMLLVLTDHQEIKSFQYEQVAASMELPMLFDTRNCIKTAADGKLQVVNFGNLHQYIPLHKKENITSA